MGHDGGESGGGVLRELLAVFGFGVDDKELEKGENRLESFLGKVKEVGEGILAAFAVEQIYEFAESQAQAMSALEHTAAQLGITTDRVQELRFAAKAAGEDADMLLHGMSRLQAMQGAAAQGSAEATKGFAALGLSMSDLKGKSADEVMLDVADGLSKIDDPAKRAAAATMLFGRQGRELLPVLGEGRNGLEEYAATFRELGDGYTEEAIKAGKDFDRQSAKTSLALTGVKNTIAKALLPVVTALSHGVQVAVTWFNKMAKDSHLVEAGLIAIGAAAMTFIGPLIVAEAPLLLLALAIAGVVLAIDDLYTFLTGGESEIGHLLDKIFGKGAQLEALQSVRATWDSIKYAVKELMPYMQKLWDGMKGAYNWVQKQSENLGDAAARYDIKRYEDEGASTHLINGKGVSRGVGGHTYEGNVIRQQAKLMTEADAAGREFHPTEIPAVYKDKQDEFFNAISTYAHRLENGSALSPGTYGPLNQPGAGNTNVNVAVTTPPGLNAKEVGEHVAKQVGEVIKQRNRDALAQVPRGAT